MSSPIASVSVVASRAFHPKRAPTPLRPGKAIALSPRRVEFAMGGSNSCPPVARSVAIRGATLLVRAATAHSSCALDLRTYAVVMTVNAPVFAPNAYRSITQIRIGYGDPTQRLTLIPPGSASAVAAVRTTCHTNRIMFHGRVLPPLSGQRGSRVGWQTTDQPPGFGWTALVQARHGRYFVTDCKSQRIVHG
jgi:hypothetical protein